MCARYHWFVHYDIFKKEENERGVEREKIERKLSSSNAESPEPKIFVFVRIVANSTAYYRCTILYVRADTHMYSSVEWTQNKKWATEKRTDTKRFVYGGWRMGKIRQPHSIDKMQ